MVLPILKSLPNALQLVVGKVFDRQEALFPVLGNIHTMAGSKGTPVIDRPSSPSPI